MLTQLTVNDFTIYVRHVISPYLQCIQGYISSIPQENGKKKQLNGIMYAKFLACDGHTTNATGAGPALPQTPMDGSVVGAHTTVVRLGGTPRGEPRVVLF